MTETYTMTLEKLRKLLEKDAPKLYQKVLVLNQAQYRNKEFRKSAENFAKNNNAVVVQDKLIPTNSIDEDDFIKRLEEDKTEDICPF